jgi:hypothetical protein
MSPMSGRANAESDHWPHQLITDLKYPSIAIPCRPMPADTVRQLPHASRHAVAVSRQWARRRPEQCARDRSECSRDAAGRIRADETWETLALILIEFTARFDIMKRTRMRAPRLCGNHLRSR